jgi:hypothetical protein
MPHQPNPRATWGGIAVVCIVLALGIWVFNRLDASQKAQECAERSGTKCAILDESALPRSR